MFLLSSDHETITYERKNSGKAHKLQCAITIHEPRKEIIMGEQPYQLPCKPFNKIPSEAKAPVEPQETTFSQQLYMLMSIKT